MRGNKLLFLGFCFALLLTLLGWYVGSTLGHRSAGWNDTAVTAKFLGAQLRQMDSENATIFLAYELQNHSNSDYRLANNQNTFFMSRLRADGSLSAQELVRLSFPTFLPAQQRARIALELPHQFNWPAENDPQFQEKLKEFINQRLMDAQAFVMFDQTTRYQIEFPGGWQEMKLASAQ